MTSSRTRAVLLAARPKTLSAAVVPVIVGTALAGGTGFTVRWTLALCALLSAAAIQIGTNLYNDVLDHERGADTTERLGPVRATSAGWLSPRAMRFAAAGCFLAAVGFGIPLVVSGGWPILALGLLSLLFGYLYTGGPYPLAYHGLGEAFVLLFFGFGAVGGTFWLQAHVLDARVAVAGLQVGLLACALLAVNNLRDVVEDAQSGKRTLAVIGGPRFGRAEIVTFALAPAVIGIAWLAYAKPTALALPLLALPMAVGALRIILREPPGPTYNVALARTAGLQVGFGILLAIGLLV